MRTINKMVAIEKARKVMVANWGGRHFTNKLDEMFDLQKKFGSKFCAFGKLTIKEKERWTKEFIVALMDEGFETLNWTNHKHWKKPIYPINEMELKYEMIDMLHFLISLFLVWEMTSKDVFSMYIAKNRENHKRQKRGY